MEYLEVKEWLDKLIRNVEERKSLVEFNRRIRTYTVENEIPIYEHIEEIADVMGMELEEVKINEFYVYAFIYKEFKFYQLRKTRLERFAGTD